LAVEVPCVKKRLKLTSSLLDEPHFRANLGSSSHPVKMRSMALALTCQTRFRTS
jgi:hypothetical protein